MEKFDQDGYVVIPDLLSSAEIEDLMSSCYKLVDDMNPAEHNTVFKSESSDFRQEYFIESVDKVRYFFEDGAMDDAGNLKVDKHKSLNKIGHAMHVQCEAFRKLTFGEKIQDICRKLELKDPVVAHSMYIFKQPTIGGVVHPHQDATYLYTEPVKKVMGIWIALEDAEEDNGCLWFVPGTHKAGLFGSWRMITQQDKTGRISAVYTGGDKDEEGQPKAPGYDTYGDWVMEPIKKGSCILIDGLVLHKSAPNHSDRSRHTFQIHLLDQSATTWSKSNWAQPTDTYQFASIYKGPESAKRA